MTTLSEHERYMRRCIKLARRALATTDAPVGALIVRDDEIVGEGVESVRARLDVTAHAEIEAVRAAAARLRTTDLTSCVLYTTVEPCVMCAYAIRLARVSKIVSGARAPTSEHAIGGYAVLTEDQAVPDRPPLVVIRDILASECAAVSQC
jgi:tRNA(adenine34) deaminase